MQVVTRSSEMHPHFGGACVPTMGALHDGHLALVRHAVSLNIKPVAVTVFVNPSQFGPGEDYQRYPRTFDADCERCAEAGADLVFAPEAEGPEGVYPDGPDQTYTPPLPDVATQPGLEDRFRPGHFAGVCQVVHRLFELVKPAAAVFGEKDYQQLLVIRAMVQQEGQAVDIVGQPTVREPEDGLAMSSRNVYLAPVQRRRASALYKALSEAKQLIEDKGSTPALAEQAMRSILLANQVKTEYAVVRDAVTLMPVEMVTSGQPLRALVAGVVGTTRLIDNIEVVSNSAGSA